MVVPVQEMPERAIEEAEKMKNPTPIILMLKKLMEQEEVVSALVKGICGYSFGLEKIKTMEILGLIEKGKYAHAQKYKITEKGIEFYEKYKTLPKKLENCLKDLDY